MTSQVVERLKLDIENKVKNASIVALEEKRGLLIKFDHGAVQVVIGDVDDTSPGEIDLVLIDTQKEQSFVIYILEVNTDILPEILKDIVLILNEYRDKKYRLVEKKGLFSKQIVLEFHNPSIVHRTASRTKKYLRPGS